MKTNILFFILINIINVYVYADNSPTGEELWRIHDREAEQAYDARTEKVLKSGSNMQIWKHFTLYHDATELKDLTMPLIYADKLMAILNPQSGTLTIKKPGLKQVFQIASKKGAKNTPCPRYSINIIEASPTHAIIKKVCGQYEATPNHYYMSTNYYLYDMETARMLGIWIAYRNQKEDALPVPKPIPTVKKIKDGYQYDWTGVDSNDPEMTKETIHAKYIRKINPETKKLDLVCVNPEDPKGEFTGGPCEMVEAPTISDERK